MDPNQPTNVVATETLDILMEISNLLNTGLDEETLALCVQLCENGVNPEALAEVIKELRRESAQYKNHLTPPTIAQSTKVDGASQTLSNFHPLFTQY
ncbi:mitotic-spindle organizing protein 1-like [Elysia marginata]|uniref:Mitotic-spindle organizing protein 1-like n=1 Tax=Elysia marginata TaxID=1093978 RepID=A0AAV4FC91_9GAST|nr:mitotic-spindle organizing protein 1-like [Elysia marginata]